jgi:hypothetical protein
MILRIDREPRKRANALRISRSPAEAGAAAADGATAAGAAEETPTVGVVAVVGGAADEVLVEAAAGEVEAAALVVEGAGGSVGVGRRSGHALTKFFLLDCKDLGRDP